MKSQVKPFERFVLDTPYLFLKKIPYLWPFIIVFYTWPPIMSGILTALLLFGLLMMHWQERAWVATVQREHHHSETPPYLDRPQAPFAYRARSFALLLAGSTLLGVLLDGRLGFTSLQWTLLTFGIMILYRDALLFGAGAVYLITDRGIGARYVPGHVDYRLFFSFTEIRKIVPMKNIKERPLRWSVLSPTRKVTQGVLLVPKDPRGFSAQIEEVLFTPTDMDAFLKACPTTLITDSIEPN
jgi:hypothetical protein